VETFDIAFAGMAVASMKPQEIRTHEFANGLTLVVESMEDVQSAAFSFLAPGGSVFDAENRNGTAALLTDLMTRGAGDKDSRQLSSELDNLGIQHSESVGHLFLGFSGASLADNIPKALPIFGDIIRRPHLPEDQFEPVKMGVAQSLAAMEDEPRQKIMIELRKRCYTSPWGIPTDGTLADLENITVEDVKNHYKKYFSPGSAIMGVAGRVDFDEICESVEHVFGDWNGPELPEISLGDQGPDRDHIEQDSSQTQIGIAYRAVPYRDPDYYAAWAAVSVLSGGMSSRLFTEVREKRGLCYAIHASLNTLKDEGRVLCYAGTTVQRAQETLDATLKELARLGDGIEESELQRCKARAKSSLVMQQESTMSRASSIARDFYHLNRVNTLEEVREKIDALTIERVLEYVHSHTPDQLTVLTIGPDPLEVNFEVP